MRERTDEYAEGRQDAAVDLLEYAGELEDEHPQVAAHFAEAAEFLLEEEDTDEEDVGLVDVAGDAMDDCLVDEEDEEDEDEE